MSDIQTMTIRVDSSTVVQNGKWWNFKDTNGNEYGAPCDSYPNAPTGEVTGQFKANARGGYVLLSPRRTNSRPAGSGAPSSGGQQRSGGYGGKSPSEQVMISLLSCAHSWAIVHQSSGLTDKAIADGAHALYIRLAAARDQEMKDATATPGQ